MDHWELQGILQNPPEKAESLRIDKQGRLYWSDKSKSWTKGVYSSEYSAHATDRVIANKVNKPV